jgi:hypothetical protein
MLTTDLSAFSHVLPVVYKVFLQEQGGMKERGQEWTLDRKEELLSMGKS